MQDCLFCKIVSGELKTDFIYEDDDVVAFNDISPKAPHHFLCIPKQHISTINDITPEQGPIIGKMILAAQHICKERGIADDGYRLVMNCNADGGQTVFHIHLHVLAGRQMQWPPG